MKQPIRWAYGVTTCPERIENHLLKRTLKSLVAAGFDKPRLFVDGMGPGMGLVVPSSDPAMVTQRCPGIHLSGNWILALWELYLRDPTAHRFVLFQDDIVTCKNLRTYLTKCPYEPQSYYNLCLYEQNEALANGRTGWYHSNQRGRGAQALMFDNETVRELLGSKHLVDSMQDVRRGPCRVDGKVIDALHKKGWREFVHMPSLVAHVGNKSTIGHNIQTARRRSSATFPGEEWDPFLPAPDTLEDHFNDAAAIGDIG